MARVAVGKALARDQNTRIVIEKSIFRQSIVDAFLSTTKMHSAAIVWTVKLRWDAI
jgi:hypothetical protein